MTIELKLDTNALASIIDLDGDFKFKLQQAILQNIANRYIKSNDHGITSQLQLACDNAKEEILTKYTTSRKDGNGWNARTIRELNDSTKKEILKICGEYLSTNLHNLIRDAVAEASKTITAEEIRRRAAATLDQYTNKYIEEQIRAKFAKAISAIKL